MPAKFDVSRYQIAEPERLLTPCLLVYPAIIEQNLREMIRLAGGVDFLRPHVKTHKTAEIVRMQIDLGITKFKCATLAEARMLAQCEARDVLVAYQPVGPAAAKLLELVKTFPATRFSTVVDNLGAAKILEQCCAAVETTLEVLVDIDCGMHRTGIAASCGNPGSGALDLYNYLTRSPWLNAAGLHVYDGHNHQPSRGDREAAVAAMMGPVEELVQQLELNQDAVPKLVCGGTPTFPVFASRGQTISNCRIEFSPGTCVLSDFNYGRDYSDLGGIQHAAVLLTRVVSKQHETWLTVDLGHKAVAGDPPAGSRCHFLSAPDAIEIKHNEEHLIIETLHADEFEVGDVMYALPAHICPTVALHAELQVVENGKLTGTWRVAARDRIYH